MRIVNMHEAKTNLSKLVERAVESGEPFIIAKAGKPMVKVVPAAAQDRGMRRIGFLRGHIQVPADFDTMHQDEVETLFGTGA